jgi:uncharacterized protein YjbI with pentapeptide repeats
MTDPERAQVDRINEISAIARTSWLALLGYLAFIGISLLAVEDDADFFVPTRRTDLPLVGVAIPTYAFFLFAPILAAALYVYLHVHLLKLWDALADAPSTIENRPLGEHLHPWIANDYALGLRGCGALRPRPMRWLGNLATRLLVWIAGPFVLAGFWWRSMPAHDEWLTLAIAAALLVTLYAGFTSWWTLRARMRFPSLPAHPWHRRLRRPAAIALTLLVIVASWLRTEGGLDHYANRLVDLADAAFGTALFKDCAPYNAGFPVPGQSPGDCFFASGDPKEPADVQRDRITALPWLPKLTYKDWVARILLDEPEPWNPLARTDLASDELVDLPESWRTPETARAAFRVTWCEREGLSMAVCDHPLSADRPTPATRAAARQNWCGSDGTDTDACLAGLADLDTRFERAWTEERAAILANLPRLALAERDLRNATAIQASLVAADLGGARLEGADLRGARLEGADLSKALLEGADLSEARLEGAYLREARLEGANLGGARLEGAHLRWARLEDANLSGARLEGADLSEARLEGAHLVGALLEGADLSGARLEGAHLFGARLEGAFLGGAQLKGANLREAPLERAFLSMARLEGADLSLARLEGADLGEARLERADLRWARLEEANLGEARLEGADLRYADFRGSDWAGASSRASPAQFADFRGVQYLTQTQLDQMIGNAGTLLPDTGNLTIPSCWKTPPEGFDALVERVSEREFRSAEDVRSEFLCPAGEEPQRTGTRLPVDAPYPAGHPLADR